MTTLINVPQSLDDQTFEQVLEQLVPLAPDAKIIVDARHTRWASPYGLAGLLTLGQSRVERPGFYPPERDETGSYWARAGFYKHAEELYDFHARPQRAQQRESSVLLELTHVAASADVHDVVKRVEEKSNQILEVLQFEASAIGRFSMALSEACQNIGEHAGCGGWVGIQTYRFMRRLDGRKVVVIAVCDAGRGIRRSLEMSPAPRTSDRWSDAIALEEAVLNGVSRFPDKGRGQGFKGMRKFVERWDGKLSVRSGTARLDASIPSWNSEQLPRQDSLSEFPGVMLQIMLPERIA